MSTTGHNLNLNKAERLKELGLHSVTVSLDHYKEEIHDEYRGYKGAFKEAIKAIEIFKEVGVYTSAFMVPSGSLINEKEFWRYIEFAHELKVHQVFAGILVPMGKVFPFDFSREHKDFIKKLRSIQALVNKDISYPTLATFSAFENIDVMGCRAGHIYCAINNDGEVFPCVVTPVSFGNILREDFKIIWNRMYEYFKTTGRVCYARRIVTPLAGKIERMDEALQIDELDDIKDKMKVDDGVFLGHLFKTIKGWSS